MFTTKTLYKDVAILFHECDACAEAMAYLDGFLNEPFENIIKISKESWVDWCIKTCFHEFDDGARKALLNAITDPSRAFNIYRKIGTLTDSEDIILKEKWENELPEAQRALDEGIVTREKLTTI